METCRGWGYTLCGVTTPLHFEDDHDIDTLPSISGRTGPDNVDHEEDSVDTELGGLPRDTETSNSIMDIEFDDATESEDESEEEDKADEEEDKADDEEEEDENDEKNGEETQEAGEENDRDKSNENLIGFHNLLGNQGKPARG